LKRCTVVCDTASGIRVCELRLPEESTVETALQAARTLLGDRGVDWDRAATGIYGKICGRAHCWLDGDRIELYRPLQADPKAGRRERAGRR
jgi:putative ubiquitin-RnfH superfamily antitoxin RatB of RatAB toxin-antitoxin module